MRTRALAGLLTGLALSGATCAQGTLVGAARGAQHAAALAALAERADPNQAEPDGTTLLFTTVGAVAINPALRGNLPYDPGKDFAAVGLAVRNSTMLVVSASMPVNSASNAGWHNWRV